jgi:hypothetical protein
MKSYQELAELILKCRRYVKEKKLHLPEKYVLFSLEEKKKLQKEQAQIKKIAILYSSVEEKSLERYVKHIIEKSKTCPLCFNSIQETNKKTFCPHCEYEVSEQKKLEE